MLKLINVSKYYNTEGILSKGLDNINLEFNNHDFVVITGESGSGKSTLLNIIGLNDSYDSGSIIYDNIDTSTFSIDEMDDFRANNIAFIYQNYNLIDSYTVLQNVMLPLIIKGISYHDAKTKALDIIKQVGLSSRIHNRSTMLSGGEKQRVAIARSIASDANILICDEATGNLDSKTGKEIVELIYSLTKEKLVLYVTHNYDEIKDYATKTVVLEDAKVKEVICHKESVDSTIRENVKEHKTNTFLLNLFNIKSTPKKSILISSLFLVISLFIFIAFSVFYQVKADFDNPNKSRSVYYGDNYLITLDNDLDLKGNINKYYFTESPVKPSNFNSYLSMIDFIPSYEAIEGKIFDSSDDFSGLLCVPDFYYDDTYCLSFINNTIKYNSFNIKITGVIYSSKLRDFALYTNAFNDENFKRDIYESTLSNLLNYDSNIVNVIIDDSYTVPTLKLRTNKGKLLEYNNVLVPFEYEIILGETYGSNVLYLSTNHLELFPKNLRIYTDDVDDMKDNIKLLEDNNIPYYYPFTDVYDYFVNTASLVLLFLGLSLLTYLLAVITYLLLSRIYTTKIKEYVIMRSLGLKKHDLKKMLYYETCVLGIIMSLILYLICYITIKQANNFFLKSFDYFTFSQFIIFLIIITIFSFFVANKFLKRLFKKTTNKLLKEDII